MFAAILPPLLTDGEMMLQALIKVVLTVAEREGLQKSGLDVEVLFFHEKQGGLVNFMSMFFCALVHISPEPHKVDYFVRSV